MLKKELDKVTLPCHITMTRLSPKMLDVDNLPMSMKSLTDEIAGLLIPEKGGWYITKKGSRRPIRGHADSDNRLGWSYTQEKAKTQGVKIVCVFGTSNDDGVEP